MSDSIASDRERLQTAGLRGADDRYWAILESITDAFYALDRDWRFTYVNGKAEALIGRSRGDLLGHNVWELYPDAVETDFYGAFHRAMGLHTPVMFEAFYPPHDRWYELHAYPSEGGISVYFRDISERKRAEAEKAEILAASEKQRRLYETALSNTPDFLYTLDLEGRLTYVNVPVLALWRRSLDETLGRTFLDLGFPIDLAGLLYRQVRQVVETGRSVKHETPYTGHLEGRQYEYLFAPVLGADGAVEAVAGSTRDVTDRRRHEAELRASRQFLSSSIDALAAHIAVLDEGGWILLVNEAWRRFGAANSFSQPDHGVGSNYLAAFDLGMDDECDGRLAVRGIEDVLAGRLPSFELEYPCHGPTDRHWFLMRATRFDFAGSARAVVSHENITERRRAEEEIRAAKEEAEAANRAKDQFLAILSHELRTPLNPILLAASSMLEGSIGPGELMPTLEMIRHNVNLQARLIDDLLDVMRIVRGKMPLHWGIADFHGLIRLAIQVCQSQILGRKIRLVLDLAAEHHHVNGDSARFQQVLWNLVRNATKFTPSGGTVTVRTGNVAGPGSGPDRLVIEVADTGIGIEPEVLPTIFDPFQQGETTITRRFGGLGLGLAICKGILEAHGATLSARSEGKDRGAAFRFELETIPDPDGLARADREGIAGVLALDPPPLRILVVEDEPATLRLMARLLRGLGHAVTTADTVAGALEAEEDGEFQLIISDIGLTDGSGLDLMRQVTDRRGAVPSIALTGYGMEEDIQRSREAGFAAHMTKPIDFTRLGAMIRQVIT